MFWIEAGLKETIKRDHLSMYQLLFGRLSPDSESPTVEEAVIMVKSWFHGRSRRSLVIFDSANTIDKTSEHSGLQRSRVPTRAKSGDRARRCEAM
jgi:hypothetical protein